MNYPINRWFVTLAFLLGGIFLWTVVQGQDPQATGLAGAGKVDNKAAGEAFLAENAKKPSITTTESGLQYEIIEQGDGDSPVESDAVTVHYKGTTIDGQVFDSSYDRGEPATFPLNRVIAGWTEGLQLMKEGGKFRFYIPSELAYGEREAGSAIPANSVLIFDVELIKVHKSEKNINPEQL